MPWSKTCHLLSNGLQLTCRHRSVFFKYMSNGLFHIYWYGSSYQVHKNPNLQWSFMNKMFIFWYKYIEDLVNLKLRYGFEMRTLTVEPENWVFWLLFVYFCAFFFKRRIFFYSDLKYTIRFSRSQFVNEL